MSLKCLSRLSLFAGTHATRQEWALTKTERGYVALAVVGENGSLSRDLDTGFGSDRQANMVAFAVGALQLVKEFILVGSGGGDRGGEV